MNDKQAKEVTLKEALAKANGLHLARREAKRAKLEQQRERESFSLTACRYCVYDPDAKSITMYISGEPDYSVPVASNVTIYRSIETDAIVGVRVTFVNVPISGDAGLSTLPTWPQSPRQLQRAPEQ